MEDFEFKPLTEGLGFNKKAETLKSEIKSTMANANASMNTEPVRSSIFPKETAAPAPETATTRAASQSISDLMASLPPSLDFLDDKQDLTRRGEMPFGMTPVARPQIYQPLAPRENNSSTLPAPGTRAGSPMAAATVGAAMGTPAMMNGGVSASNARAGYAEGMYQSFGKTVPRADVATSTEGTGQLVPVAVNFSAALIDAMVVAGVTTILLVCIITITHINLVAMLSNASTDTATQKNLVFLFLAVLQMYMLVSRAFFGATLGEWAFDTQLGTDEQQKTLYYPALAMWRSLVILFTGLATLPLLSFAFRRDLGKYISGLQLLRRA